MAAVFFYISGHGFGHASRQIEIINALGAADPSIEIVVRSTVPRWKFERTLRAAARLEPGECDTGVVQFDSLRLDVPETIRRAAAFHAELPSRAAREAALLRERDARLVIVDAPPLACAAAAQAQVPAIVVANFTWDWIYEGYTEALTSAPGLVPQLQDAYRHAQAAWRLPLHGGFETFAETQIADVPFVARHARHDRRAVRLALGLPLDRPLALFSFGGLRVHDMDFAQLDCLGRYDVLLTPYELPGIRDADRPGVHAVDDARLYGAGLGYEDLVAAADVVLTKPGYGIISECLANGAAMLYTSRGQFREYPVLVEALPQLLPSAYLGHESLFAGRWLAALDAALVQPPPAVRPPTNGAEVIAGMILERI